MGVFTGKGKSIKENIKDKGQNDGDKLDFDKVKINKQLKKEGDSIRVRLLTDEDFTTYEAHGAYDKGIWTTPCINPDGTGENRCLMCEAVKIMKELKSSTRFLFAFYDIDMEMIRYIDVSFTQGKSLMQDIEDNAEDIGDTAFTLKRSGSGTKTTYKLSAILKLEKKDPEAYARFEKAEELRVDENFFEKALYIKSTNQMGIDLEKAGIDVEGALDYVIEDDSKDGEAKPQNDAPAPDPDKVF